MNSDFYSIEVKDIHGKTQKLEDYKNKVLLIVNVASECGFTPQYEGLEKLQETYHEKGFSVLGFPCNQFGGQEPGDNSQIEQFCKTKFGVQFPMFSKIDVNGNDAHPLYVYLKKQAKGILGSEAIKWNFTKFLINRDASEIKRFAPQTKPEELQKEIEKLL